MTTVIDQIVSALDMATKVVGDITQDHLAEKSLCLDWDVRDELNHLVGGMRIFAAELTDTDAGADHHADWLGDNHHDAFIAAAELDRAAWNRPGVLDTTVRLSFGPVPGSLAAVIHLTEIVVHGADLAVVTCQEQQIDQRLCARLLADIRAMDFDAFRRPGMFGDELPEPDSAAPHRRLLAFVGRDLTHIPSR
jgi:uncharacterized protein (TIGR03086 family)